MHIAYIKGVPLVAGARPTLCKECKEEADYKVYIDYRPIGLCTKHLQMLVVDGELILREVENERAV